MTTTTTTTTTTTKSWGRGVISFCHALGRGGGGLNAVCGWDNLLHTDEFKKKMNINITMSGFDIPPKCFRAY